MLPNSVDETFTVGLYAPDAPPLLLESFSEIELESIFAQSDEELRQLVLDKKVEMGIVLGPGLVEALNSGAPTSVPLYVRADAPQEVKESFSIHFRLFFNDLSYRLTDQPLAVEATE